MSTLILEHRLTEPQVLDRLAQLMPHLKHRFEPDQLFRDGGFDSLDLVELLCVIESEFAVSLDDKDLAASTVGELAELISERTLHRDTGLRPVHEGFDG